MYPILIDELHRVSSLVLFKNTPLGLKIEVCGNPQYQNKTKPHSL
jgi:hypothetical protein